MRAQVSVEYLIIIGFALGVLIPGVFLFYKYSQSTGGMGASNQINEIGLNVVSTARSTYSLGINARKTLEFVMPSTVRETFVGGVNNEEFVIRYETPMGYSDAVFFSDSIPLTTDLMPFVNVTRVHPGLTRYRIESLGTTVKISEVLG